MRRATSALYRRSLPWALLAGFAAPAVAPAAAQDSVPFYHATPDHAGLFTVTNLRAATVAATSLDTAFNGAVSGVINAAPLYWHQSGVTDGWVIVATDNNQVSALDEVTGLPVWQLTLGPAASRSGQCGNINPVGVTGTPVIDTATGTLYADAVVTGGTNGQQHALFAVSLATGTILPGWPVLIAPGVIAHHVVFRNLLEEQRGALALVDGEVYIPYGGYIGDCGAYHGMVVGVSTAGHAVAGVWQTASEKGGIWAPGGIVADGTGLYIGTGNTRDAQAWGGGESIVHLQPTLATVISPTDYFSPIEWRMLDEDDLNLAGTGPTLVYAPGAPATVLALGKNGYAYLLQRDSLGGITHPFQALQASPRAIRSATARYTSGDRQMVVVNAQGMACTSTSNGVVAPSIAGTAPRLAVAWCAPLKGQGAPIVTTSDGQSNPIVWITGAEGDEALHALDGTTGAALYTSAALPNTVRHFSTLTVANGRLFVPADNKIFAFTLGGH